MHWWKAGKDFVRTAVVTDGNWPGQRNRLLRNLTTAEWQALYGNRYAYSSDYILANRRAFTASTRQLARLTNILEELAEISSSFTGCHMRLAAGLVPGTAAELSGKGRFCQRLRVQLLRRDPVGNTADARSGTTSIRLLGQLNDKALSALYSRLVEDGILNGRSHLCCDPDSPQARSRLADILMQAFRMAAPQNDAEKLALDADVDRLMEALRKSDMRTHWPVWTVRRKLAYAGGCVLSVGTALGVNLALLPAAWVASPFLFTPLGIGGLLFAVSFGLRLLTTAHARLGRTHRGLMGVERSPYRSLFEAMRYHAWSARNRVYTGVGIPLTHRVPVWAECDGVYLQLDEWRSASFSRRLTADKPTSLRNIVAHRVVGHAAQLGDIAASADGHLTRIIGRTLRLAFCAASESRHVAGVTGQGLCAYDWTTHSARQSRLGALRLSIARVVGIGGADVLGGSLGCLAVSAAWASLAYATAGTAPVLMVAGVTALRPTSAALTAAALWTFSSAVEAALPPPPVNRPFDGPDSGDFSGSSGPNGYSIQSLSGLKVLGREESRRLSGRYQQGVYRAP